MGIQLGIYSPSDNKHTFWSPDFDVRAEHAWVDEIDPDDWVRRRGQRVADHKTVSDAFHGWAEGDRSSPPHPNAIRRLLGTRPLEADFGDCAGDEGPLGFPPAPLISALLIPGQYYRSLAPRLIGRLLREGLCGLRCFWHERWLEADPRIQQQLDDGEKSLASKPSRRWRRREASQAAH